MIKLKFIIPLVVAVVLMIVDHKLNIFSNVKTVVHSVITPVYVALDFPSDAFNILNDSGDGSNARLQKELLSLKVKEQQYNTLLLENQRLSEILEFSYTTKDTDFLLARVTNINQSRLTKQIVINRGSNDNINVGNIVLSEKGVIGRVVNSALEYSTVRLITDPLQYTPVVNTRSGVRGIAKGIANNDHKLIIKYVNPKSDVALGDNFSTSGIAGVFGGNYHVGVVSNILQNNQNTIDLEITPSQDINSLIFVLVSNEHKE